MGSGSLLPWGGMRSWDKSSDSVFPSRPHSGLALWLGVGKVGHRERGGRQNFAVLPTASGLTASWDHPNPSSPVPKDVAGAVGQGRSWVRPAAGQSISDSTCSSEVSVPGHLCPPRLLSEKHHGSGFPKDPGGKQ